MGKLITEGITKSTVVVVYQKTLHMKSITACLWVFAYLPWAPEIRSPKGDSLLSCLASHFFLFLSLFCVSLLSFLYSSQDPSSQKNLSSVCRADQREYRRNIQMHWIQTYRTGNASQAGEGVTRTKCQGHEQSQRLGEREKKVPVFKWNKTLGVSACDGDICMFFALTNQQP